MKPEKLARRKARELELGKKIIALPGRLYGVLYVDPPWQVAMWSDEGTDRSAENHYPTMTDDELLAMWDKLPAADDCILFLWATAPKLKFALELIDAWGFVYKSYLGWDKEIAGTGYLVRSQLELLLIATCGNAVPPTGLPGLVVSQRRQHSRKPELVAELIGDLYPTVPKLEMFARSAREGWDAWGLEAPGLS